MRDFSGKVAVVTGGASGVGRAIAAQLAGDGAKVVIADVDADSIGRTRGELASQGLTVDGMEVDVTNPDSVDALAERVFAKYGNVHLLFNNAGVGIKEAKRRIWTIPEKDWQWTYSVNVIGVTNGIRAFVPTMLERGEEGHVINTSSGNGGIASLPTTPVYASSKAAVTSLTEVLHFQFLIDDAKLQAHVLFPGTASREHQHPELRPRTARCVPHRGSSTFDLRGHEGARRKRRRGVQAHRARRGRRHGHRRHSRWPLLDSLEGGEE